MDGMGDGSQAEQRGGGGGRLLQLFTLPRGEGCTCDGRLAGQKSCSYSLQFSLLQVWLI